jgi:hypothetical protein
MIKFEIEQISNGYLIRGDLGWHENAEGDYMDDFVMYAPNLADTFALLANKCDNLMDEEMAKASTERDGNTEELPF